MLERTGGQLLRAGSAAQSGRRRELLSAFRLSVKLLDERLSG